MLCKNSWANWDAVSDVNSRPGNHVLDVVHIDATWRIRLKCSSVAEMWPYVKLLWPFVYICMLSKFHTKMNYYLHVCCFYVCTCCSMILYLKFADFGLFRQRYGKEVCSYTGSSIAHHSSSVVHYQDWRHLFFHLCLDLCTSHISGKSCQVFSIVPCCILIILYTIQW